MIWKHFWLRTKYSAEQIDGRLFLWPCQALKAHYITHSSHLQPLTLSNLLSQGSSYWMAFSGLFFGSDIIPALRRARLWLRLENHVSFYHTLVENQAQRQGKQTLTYCDFSRPSNILLQIVTFCIVWYRSVSFRKVLFRIVTFFYEKQRSVTFSNILYC